MGTMELSRFRQRDTSKRERPLNRKGIWAGGIPAINEEVVAQVQREAMVHLNWLPQQ